MNTHRNGITEISTYTFSPCMNYNIKQMRYMTEV